MLTLVSLFLFLGVSIFCQFCCTCVEPWRARLIPAPDFSCFRLPHASRALVYSSGGARRKLLVSTESHELLLFFPDIVFFFHLNVSVLTFFRLFMQYLLISCKIKREGKQALRLTHCAHRSRKIMCVMFHCSLSLFLFFHSSLFFPRTGSLRVIANHSQLSLFFFPVIYFFCKDLQNHSLEGGAKLVLFFLSLAVIIPLENAPSKVVVYLALQVLRGL